MNSLLIAYALKTLKQLYVEYFVILIYRLQILEIWVKSCFSANNLRNNMNDAPREMYVSFSPPPPDAQQKNFLTNVRKILGPPPAGTFVFKLCMVI